MAIDVIISEKHIFSFYDFSVTVRNLLATFFALLFKKNFRIFTIEFLLNFQSILKICYLLFVYPLNRSAEDNIK